MKLLPMAQASATCPLNMRVLLPVKDEVSVVQEELEKGKKKKAQKDSKKKSSKKKDSMKRLKSKSGLSKKKKKLKR